ncbi:MAG: TIGR00269 family protein [Dictyoglomaceae bacterium]
MNCKICKTKNIKKEALVNLPSYNLSLCKEHFVEWFERRVQSTIKEFHMFTKEDKILVAVSGGKDSLGLWFVLNKLGYRVDGLHIDLGINEYSEKSRKYTEEFAEKIGRNLYIVDLRSEIAPIPVIKEKIFNKPACSLCGTIKRYYMNKIAKEKGYNILATGHNLDDETSVLFGNTLNWNMEYLSRQYPVLMELENTFIRKVKPYCRITEKESAIYVFLMKIKYIEEECPLSKGALSLKYKKILGDIEEQFPGTKIRFFNNFLKKIYPLLINKKEDKIKKCKICNEPSASEICSVCNLKLKLQNL